MITAIQSTNALPVFLPLGGFVAFIFLLGLMIGSFLNVVIYRLPKMMELEWRTEALAFLKSSDPHSLSPQGLTLILEEIPAFNIAYPGSHCPQCHHAIRWYENIPVLSWCFQSAKCTACRCKISIRYPLIELLTASTSAWIAYRYGWSIQTAACLIFNALLMCAFWIDWDTQLLPDSLTMPLIWSGMILSYLGYGLVSFSESFWGVISSYSILWIIYWIFYLLFKKEGMGFGDFKLLSALGAWLGWPSLPMIVLVASLSGLSYGVFRATTGLHSPSEHKSAPGDETSSSHQWSNPLPFGPFLIAGGWLTWMVLPQQILFSLPH